MSKIKSIIAAVTMALTGVIWWGFSDTPRAKEWVSPDGRVSQQNQLDYQSTAIDLWPTSKMKPTRDSFSEITLYRTVWDDSKMERMNISAMVNGAYRFGVERSGQGEFKDMIFCFENVSPGVASCQLKIKPDGVYVTDDQGVTWRKL